jgi:hypothetical protein
MFEKMGRFTTKYRYPVSMFWVTLMVAITILMTTDVVAASTDSSEVSRDAENGAVVSETRSYPETSRTIELGLALTVVTLLLVSPTLAPALKTTLQGRMTLRLPNPRIRARLDGAETMAKSFVSGAIDRWESDGKINSKQAADLRRTMATPEAETLMKHMGAHLILSVAIAIPIPGLRSAARFGWTLAFRLKAMAALVRGKISKEEYQVARSIHSVPVMLVALVPAIGAIGYAVSDTMVKRGLGRMLLDQSAHKVPFGLYERLRIDRITAPRASVPVAVPVPA